MVDLQRIRFDSRTMGGKPCIRDTRVTVGTVLGLLASGRTAEEILKAYPYLEAEDFPAALFYGAWRSEEFDLPLVEPK